MKIINTTKQNVENTDTIQMKPEDNELLSSVNTQFSEILSEKMNGNDILTGTLTDTNFDFYFDSVSMDIQDALFFINLTQEGQFTVETSQQGTFQNLVQTEIIQNTVSQKAVEVTNHITSLIEKAQNTQKPVRISFDNGVSVVLKIDKHGKVSAEFIPGSIEVENYLRNNIAALRQRFDEQNLPYNELLYRQNNKQNRNRNKDKGEQ